MKMTTRYRNTPNMLKKQKNFVRLFVSSSCWNCLVCFIFVSLFFLFCFFHVFSFMLQLDGSPSPVFPEERPLHQAEGQAASLTHQEQTRSDHRYRNLKWQIRLITGSTWGYLEICKLKQKRHVFSLASRGSQRPIITKKVLSPSNSLFMELFILLIKAFLCLKVHSCIKKTGDLNFTAQVQSIAYELFEYPRRDSQTLKQILTNDYLKPQMCFVPFCVFFCLSLSAPKLSLKLHLRTNLTRLSVFPRRFQMENRNESHKICNNSSDSAPACRKQLSTIEEETCPVSGQEEDCRLFSPHWESSGGPTVHYYWGVPFCPRGLDPDTYTQVIQTARNWLLTL